VKTSKLVDRDRLLLLFSSVPAVHLPVTCKVNQQHKQFRLSFFQICHGLFWVCFVADQLLLLILFSLVPCTGSKECWRLATGGEGDRLLLLVAGLWALLKLGRPTEGRTAADRESKEKREHWCWGRGFRCG